MSWKHYNTETKKIEVVRTLVGDMEQFGAIVMAEDTWNVILQVSERVPWSRQSRMNTFIDDLLLVLERKENEPEILLSADHTNILFTLHLILTLRKILLLSVFREKAPMSLYAKISASH